MDLNLNFPHKKYQSIVVKLHDSCHDTKHDSLAHSNTLL